jgi:hypothetical protein
LWFQGARLGTGMSDCRENVVWASRPVSRGRLARAQCRSGTFPRQRAGWPQHTREANSASLSEVGSESLALANLGLFVYWNLRHFDLTICFHRHSRFVRRKVGSRALRSQLSPLANADPNGKDHPNSVAGTSFFQETRSPDPWKDLECVKIPIPPEVTGIWARGLTVLLPRLGWLAGQVGSRVRRSDRTSSSFG